jgi:Ca2+-binding RTX toxin-like protein
METEESAMKIKQGSSSIRGMIGLGVCLLGLVVSRNASAFTSLDNPFGNAPVMAVVNQDPVNGGHWISWKRLSDGSCFFDSIGGTSFNDDYDVVAGTGGDHLVIWNVLGTSSFCGFPVSAPNYGGHFMDLIGNSGADHLETGTGDTYLVGNAGDDVLSGATTLYMEGDAGNDTEWLGNSTTGGTYTTGDGNDCMHVPSAHSATMSCGAGTDKWQGPGTRPADCESTNSGCCPGIVC